MRTLEELKVVTPAVEVPQALLKDQEMAGQRAARARLVQDVLFEQIQAEFGLKFRADEVHERVRRTLKYRFMEGRGTRWTAIRAYERLIPAQALEKYAAAREKGLRHFYVVEPEYHSAPHPVTNRDPWLVGSMDWVVSNGAEFFRADWTRSTPVIVLAYWD